MDHKGTIRIETQRLLLRPFSMEDAAFAFRNWMGDEKVTEYLRWKPHRNIEETKDTLLRWTALYLLIFFYPEWMIPEAPQPFYFNLYNPPFQAVRRLFTFQYAHRFGSFPARWIQTESKNPARIRSSVT